MLGVMVSLESVLAVIVITGLLLWSVWNWVRFRVLSFQVHRPSEQPAKHSGPIRKARIYGIATNVFLAEVFSGTSNVIHKVWRVIYKFSLGLLILTLLICAGIYVTHYVGVL
jgi:hypothetical protein